MSEENNIITNIDESTIEQGMVGEEEEVEQFQEDEEVQLEGEEEEGVMVEEQEEQVEEVETVVEEVHEMEQEQEEEQEEEEVQEEEEEKPVADAAVIVVNESDVEVEEVVEEEEVVVVEEEEDAEGDNDDDEYEDFTFDKVESDVSTFTWTQDTMQIHIIVPLPAERGNVDESNIECTVDSNNRRVSARILSPSTTLIDICVNGSVDALDSFEVINGHLVLHIPKRGVPVKQWDYLFQAPVNLDGPSDLPIADELDRINRQYGDSVDGFRQELQDEYREKFENMRREFLEQKETLMSALGIPHGEGVGAGAATDAMEESEEQEAAEEEESEVQAMAMAAEGEEEMEQEQEQAPTNEEEQEKLAEDLHMQALRLNLKGSTQEAFELYLKSAHLGNSIARFHIASILGSETAGLYGVAQDIEKSLFYYRLAAFENNNVEAIGKLADFHTKGEHGVEKSIEKTMILHAMAGILGDASSMLAMGLILYRRIENVEQDYAKALAWFTLAMNRGLVMAAYYLGIFHRDANGIPKSLVKALKYFKLAKFWTGVTGGSAIDDAIRNTMEMLSPDSSEDSNPDALLESAMEELDASVGGMRGVFDNDVAHLDDDEFDDVEDEGITDFLDVRTASTTSALQPSRAAARTDFLKDRPEVLHGANRMLREQEAHKEDEPDEPGWVWSALEYAGAAGALFGLGYLFMSKLKSGPAVPAGMMF